MPAEAPAWGFVGGLRSVFQQFGFTDAGMIQVIFRRLCLLWLDGTPRPFFRFLRSNRSPWTRMDFPDRRKVAFGVLYPGRFQKLREYRARDVAAPDLALRSHSVLRVEQANGSPKPDAVHVASAQGRCLALQRIIENTFPSRRELRQAVDGPVLKFNQHTASVLSRSLSGWFPQRL